MYVTVFVDEPQMLTLATDKAAQAAAQAAAAAQAQAVQSDLSRALGSSVQLSPEQALDILQKFGFGGFPQTSNAYGPGDDAKYVNPSGERIGTTNAFSGGFTGMAQPEGGAFVFEGQHGHAPTLSSFSPFSPDPNYLAGIMAERERENAMAASLRDSDVSRPMSGYGGMARSVMPSSNGDRFSTPSNLGNGRSTTPSQQSAKYQANDTMSFVLNKSATPFQLNRAPGRPGPDGQSSSRPSFSQANPSNLAEKDSGAIRDFNGTLASLDLDTSSGRSPATNTDSSSSVQFRMSPGSPPS